MKTKPFEDLVLAICAEPELCEVDWNYNAYEVGIRCSSADGKRLVGYGGTAFRALIVLLNSIDRQWTLLRIESDGKHNERLQAGNQRGDHVDQTCDLLNRVLTAAIGRPEIAVEYADSAINITATVKTRLPEYRVSVLSDALRTLFIPIGVHFNRVLHVNVHSTSHLPHRHACSR